MELQPTLNQQELAAGSDVGPYRLSRSLGRGGMAEVFMGVHRHLGHVRAVKVLLPEADSSGGAQAKRLLTEARATARLHHPAIVEIFDCDVLPSGRAFIAMEYLQGESARQWLSRVGGLQRHPELAAALVGVVADALAHAHEQGIIHRDIKPDNLFLVPDAGDPRRFSVKVLDFGVAKMLRETPLVKTRTGCTIGTPIYMAPEQWMARSQVDHRADIYSLGCVFFELLAGRTPFEGESAEQMMVAHLGEAPPAVRSLVPSVPAELERLLQRMLAKSPDDRPQGMEEVLAVLESSLGTPRAGFGALLSAPPHFRVLRAGAPAGETTEQGLGPGAGPLLPTEPLERSIGPSSVTPVRPPPRPARRWPAALAITVALGASAALGAMLVSREPAGTGPGRSEPAVLPLAPVAAPVLQEEIRKDGIRNAAPSVAPQTNPEGAVPPVEGAPPAKRTARPTRAGTARRSAAAAARTVKPPPGGRHGARQTPAKNTYLPVGD